MKVVVDLDLHEAIQDFGVRSPAGSYEFKSQDTINWLFYFVRNGVVQDLTSGLAIKFGMIATGDATNTLLAYQTTFTYTTDSAGNICYECPVNFNTAQMATAITGKSQLPCTAEVRYQTADAEIVHTLNISTLVFPTILIETGVTPPNVSTGYPDASALELLVHKDQPSGYAGLNASAKLFGAQIPVDGQTVIINTGGQIASGSVLAYTAANFTTPAVNATVAVTFVSTSNLHAGQYVRIPIAGYYSVASVTDSTHAVLTNIGDPLNAISGTTIVSGAALLPAQAVSGSGGGSPGQNAFTTLATGFTVPAVGATVPITVVSTAWMGGAGYAIFITGAGYYVISSITDSTHLVVTNTGSAANQPPGSAVATAGVVTSAGPQGAQGASGAGLAAYDTLASSFTVPTAGSNVTITIGNTAWMGQNQIIFISSGGYYQVANVINATSASITNLGYVGNAAPASTVASGSRVSPGGLQGLAGAGGAGLNAYTTLSANFTQPAVFANVTINVGSTGWMGPTQAIYVNGGGYYQIVSIGDATHVTVTNLGYANNAAPGATVTGSGTQGVSPGGFSGPNGGNAFTTTTATYTQPASGSNITVSFGSTAWMSQNQNVFINGGGYYQVVSITDPAHAVLQNLGAPGNSVSGTVVNSGATVVAGGATGLTGPTGATGPSGGIGEAPTDGQIYGRQSSAWTPVTGGGGGAFDPRSGVYFYDDFICGGSLDTAKWQQASNGGGGATAGTSGYGYDSTRKTNGLIELATGTGTSGTFAQCGGGIVNGYITSNTQGEGIVLGAGTFDIAARVAIEESSLPVTGVGYTIRFGLVIQNATISGNFPGGNQPNNSCVVMEYSPDQNSGLFRIGYCFNTNAGNTYVNCSGTPVANTYGWWELKITSAGVATAYFNGTSLGSTTISGSLLGILFCPYIIFWRNNAAATNYHVAVDTFFYNYPYTR